MSGVHSYAGEEHSSRRHLVTIEENQRGLVNK